MAVEVVDVEGKVTAKYAIGMDHDKDGVKSASVSIVVELNKKEAIEEALKKAFEGKEVPQWLKALLGMA